MQPARRTPSTGPLRIGFVGGGSMARLHLQALRRVGTPHAVIGVADPRSGAAEEFAALGGGRAFATIDALIAEGAPDIVHVVSPAGHHFEPARQALQSGAHVYVEKPFVETHDEAMRLLALARERGLQVCAGHQLVEDPAFVQLLARAATLMPLSLVDSHFAFRSPTLQLHRAGPRALASQLLDILPHPLYTLIAVLERLVPEAPEIELASVSATPTDMHVLLRAGPAFGRLAVSIKARPVASTLTVSGAGGAITADFVRAMLIGSGNPGTVALEKIINPIAEGWQQATRTVASVTRRVLHGGDYPGLSELIGAFYDAVATGKPSPLTPEHLGRVTLCYERLASAVRDAAAAEAQVLPPGPVRAGDAPLAVVTGARGFLGKQIARALAMRGFRVRGVGRSADRDDRYVAEWVMRDLSHELDDAALAGADVVVHAAAETTGGFEAHQKNSIDATRNVVQAMGRAGIRNLVYISTISVLEPPRGLGDVQAEATPMARDPRRYGAYAWGKTLAEQVVRDEAPGVGVEACIIRPAALIDYDAIDFPGLLGRRLVGGLHLGLGRPSLPLAVLDVSEAGDAIAWCAQHFDEAPRVVNLFEGSLRTRRDTLTEFRRRGWRGRVLWVPVSAMAGLVMGLKTAMALARRQEPEPLAAWSVLRPRWFDPTASRRVLEGARQPVVQREAHQRQELVPGAG